LLHPRKAKEFISDVASELGHTENIVNDVVMYYWQEIRKSLSTLKHQRIHLTNLGDFVIKHWKVDDKMEMLEHWEEQNRQKGLQQMTARFKVAETLYDLKNLKKIMEEENQRKDFIKLHKKKINEPKRKHNKNLEEQRSDN
jgi:nitrogenase subunit NifH